jgi:hypothetical protein
MALNEKEALRPDTMSLLSTSVRAGFPVGYARIESRRIHPGGSVNYSRALFVL